MTVTFFGHRSVPTNVGERVKTVLTELIEKEDARDFYVGNQGDFDFAVWKALGELKREYPHIERTIVLAYMPKEKLFYADSEETLFPEAVAAMHPRFAISQRNEWLILKSETVITYVVRSGGAARFKEKAIKCGKRVIELSSLDESK